MKSNVIFFSLLLLAFAFRVYGGNWDQGYHLHPDERFLTMVANAEKLPSAWIDYFIPARSPLNPYNVGYSFFVYGTFPLTVAKMLAVVFGYDTYARFTLLGRFLSACADILVIIFVYKIAAFLEKKYHIDRRIKFFASFLYAVAVLPIQLSHFFAVDTFLNLFMIAALYYGLKRSPIPSALFFGLALGTKITAFFIFPLLLFLTLFQSIKNRRWIVALGIFIAFLLVAYIAVRIADPKMFASGNFFNPTINPLFIQNLTSLSSFSAKDVWYPPAVQWLSKTPILFPLQNIIFFGVGLPYFVLVIIGSYFFIKEKRGEFIAVSVWAVIFFLYQSTRFAATMRYFIFLYPLFAVFAAFGLVKIVRFKLWCLILLLLILIWPVSFMVIYKRKHSRVNASEWIRQNIPRTAYLAEEHWDDFLPVDDGYEGMQMPVFDPDTSEKWKVINETLTKADYYIITSNRAYGSILSASEKYPQMSRWYRQLFDGKLAFKKVQEFTSYPALNFGFFTLELKDDWAEEAFTVFDHPKVIIFKKGSRIL